MKPARSTAQGSWSRSAASFSGGMTRAECEDTCTRTGSVPQSKRKQNTAITSRETAHSWCRYECWQWHYFSNDTPNWPDDRSTAKSLRLATNGQHWHSLQRLNSTQSWKSSFLCAYACSQWEQGTAVGSMQPQEPGCWRQGGRGAVPSLAAHRGQLRYLLQGVSREEPGNHLNQLASYVSI